MHIAVVGIGGVGGYYGGRLAHHYEGNASVRIDFIARGEHLRKIREKGLEVRGLHEVFTARPYLATDQPAKLGVPDLILFCVKAYDLEESAEMFRETVHEQTVIVTLLNGVDNEKRLSKLFPQATVLNGCVYISAFIERPGLIRQASGSCKLFFGTESGSTNRYASIEKVFTDAEIDAEYRDDIKAVVWEKYLFVSPLASATAYLGKTFGEILKDEVSMSFLKGLVREVELIARDQGVEFPPEAAEAALGKVALFPPETKTSLQMDFEKGKTRTELETFTGYVVQYGGKHGIPVPYHREAYDALKAP